MRRERSVEIVTDSGINISWDELKLQAFQFSTQIERPRHAKTINSWRTKTTVRANFLMRILQRSNSIIDDAKKTVESTLSEIWEVIRQGHQGLLIRIGDSHRLNPKWWRISCNGKNDKLFKCNICGRLQNLSVKNVCQRNRCPGTLEEISNTDLEENHYRSLYEENLPVNIRVEEHTAQIDKEIAREFQKNFKQNRIDVLSCSTTFELGVDLGDLDTVFLRNVPPEPFNYAQRVGRAGRRKGYPGIAITYARRSPHDIYHYNNPFQMLSGKTRTTTLSLSNEKIILRHLVATCLSNFFRSNQQRFENVNSLIQDFSNPKFRTDLLKFLISNKDSLRKFMLFILSSVPNTIIKSFGFEDDSWIEKIVGLESRLSSSEVEASSDYQQVIEIENNSVKNRNYGEAEWAKKRVQTIASEDVLSFLSRKSVIPKYGFPVDVVELDTHQVKHQNQESTTVSLQRDLSIAIAEFAPGSKLIANKKEWTSFGLKKVIGKAWEIKRYIKCTEHNIFEQFGINESPLYGKCCDNMIENGVYIIPRFGFVTSKDKPTEPKRRSPKIFTTRPYFVGFNTGEPHIINIKNIEITPAVPGKMVILCEGRKGECFYICRKCGAGFKEYNRRFQKKHTSPLGSDCFEKINRPGDCFALGHEFETDVVRVQFTATSITASNIWFTYSLAFAIVEGVAEVLEIPSNDLNSTVANKNEVYTLQPIILYDNVPGGAGLVARLQDEEILKHSLEAALERVSGKCGCGENDSCYGCLRNYRNQFVHNFLQRGPISKYLQQVLNEW